MLTSLHLFCRGEYDIRPAAESSGGTLDFGEFLDFPHAAARLFSFPLCVPGPCRWHAWRPPRLPCPHVMCCPVGLQARAG